MQQSVIYGETHGDLVTVMGLVKWDSQKMQECEKCTSDVQTRQTDESQWMMSQNESHEMTLQMSQKNHTNQLDN